MFCPKCGTENVGTNRFCLACGGALAAGPSVAPPAPDSVVEPSIPLTVPPQLPIAQLDVAKRCPVCARDYPAAQRFCNVDGITLVAVTSAEPVTVSPPPPPSPTPTPTPKVATVTPANAKPVVSPAEEAATKADTASATPEPITPAQPAPTVPPVDPVGLECPTCGVSFPVGVRFCDQDGATLVGRGTAATVRVLPPVVADLIYRAEKSDVGGFEIDEDEAPNEYGGGYSERRNSLAPALIVGALLVLAAGGGYAYWSGMFDKWLGNSTDPELALHDKTRPGGTSTSKVPGLLGSYKAHLADQDIVLTIATGEPKSLVTSAGTVTYLNAVNGGTCTALLVPISGGGIGGDTGNAVSFRQSAVPGKPACPKDIPVKMDISSQPSDASGIVRSIAVEWHSPNSEKILMAGKLEREAGQ